MILALTSQRCNSADCSTTLRVLHTQECVRMLSLGAPCSQLESLSTQSPRYCYCAYRSEASPLGLGEELKHRLAPEQNYFSAQRSVCVCDRERGREIGRERERKSMR